MIQMLGRSSRKAGMVVGDSGYLHFAPWEQIFYGEFDGNRPKRVLVKIIGD